MQLMLMSAAILTGLAVFFMVLGLTRVINAGSEVDDRLDAYATMSAPFGMAASEQSGLSDRVSSYLNDRSFAGSVRASLARADVKLTVAEYLLIKIAAVVLPFALFWLLTGYMISGLIFALVGFLIPEVWLRTRARKRVQEFVLQLPDTLALIIGGMRAGFSLQQSILNVSKEAPEPTATEFMRLGQELQLGIPLQEALDGMVRRIKSPDLEMIVSVFKIHGRVGGNLAMVLENVGSTIRERVRLRREVQVITAQQRYASYVLGALPFVLGMILMAINPEYMLEMFQWNIFLCIPITAFIMTIAGFLVIRRIVDIKI
ncbi:MAG: type II secretion system F family protein [Chloroflexi bacterium]|nr:type II secretion system F family protein [Chloroflexota bacterium]